MNMNKIKIGTVVKIMTSALPTYGLDLTDADKTYTVSAIHDDDDDLDNDLTLADSTGKTIRFACGAIARVAADDVIAL